MDCGVNHNCLSDALEVIVNIQTAAEGQCPADLLSKKNLESDTIPFILFDNNSKILKAIGNVGGLLGGNCFTTPFFKVHDIDNNCATLTLLKPYKNGSFVDFGGKDDISEINKLVNTDFCIEVDLTCFCAIHFLDPRLVNCNFKTNASKNS